MVVLSDVGGPGIRPGAARALTGRRAGDGRRVGVGGPPPGWPSGAMRNPGAHDPRGVDAAGAGRERPGSPRALGRRRPARAGALAAVLLVAVLTPPAAAQEAPVATVRVLSINILHGGVLSGWQRDDQHLEARLDLLTDELRGLSPDVIAVQEASRGWGRGDVAARLAARLGMQHAYVSGAFRFFGSGWVHWLVSHVMNFEEGPAVLSRFPIVRWEAFALPSCGRRFEPRVLLLTELDAPWGPLTVFSTHTSGDPCHTRRVAELVREHRGAGPAVVMGDFNAVESSEAIQALTGPAGFVDAFRAVRPDDPGPTVWQPVTDPVRRARRRVDYVFLAPGGASTSRPVDSRVVIDVPGRLADGTVLWPSDHYGVLADVAILATVPRPAGHDGAGGRAGPAGPAAAVRAVPGVLPAPGPGAAAEAGPAR